MKQYLDLVRKVLNEGTKKKNRTGVDTISVSGAMFEHNMKDGFPLLTTKKMPFKLILSELEFFIKGIHNKNWLKERNNHIWDEWCSPDIVPYGTDEKTKKKMLEEPELGPIYGVQWRNFNNSGVDQLKNLIEEIKKNPTSRRLIVSSWNPIQIPHMALPPCHILFQILIDVDTKQMDLIWYQRSCDLMLGIPFNIASYGHLLELIAKETGYEPHKLVGMFADLHIYENHIPNAERQLLRPILRLPRTEIKAKNRFLENQEKEEFDIFDWEYTDTSLIDYESSGTLKFDIAV